MVSAFRRTVVFLVGRPFQGRLFSVKTTLMRSCAGIAFSYGQWVAIRRIGYCKLKVGVEKHGAGTFVYNIGARARIGLSRVVAGVVF